VVRRRRRSSAGARSRVTTGPYNIRNGIRWNAAFAYLEPARGRPNLTIRAGAHAERVVFRDERAIGAIVDGENVEADLIVLSAGAIGSPRILLRSGIEAGSNLQDHVSTKLVFETSDVLRTDVPVPFSNGLVKTEDFHLLPIQDRHGEGAHITVALLRPHSRGRVTLDEIDHRLLSDERDRDALHEGLELARELAEHEALRALVRPVTSSVDEAAGIYFHPVGTCSEAVEEDLRCARLREPLRVRRVGVRHDPAREHSSADPGPGRADRGGIANTKVVSAAPSSRPARRRLEVCTKATGIRSSSSPTTSWR
jgi:choline dehydrogenase-like flavoprotein